MSRSKWKGPYVQKMVQYNKNLIAARACEILPKFVGLTFLVHDGRSYTSFDVVKDMVGHKFGEFFNTRVKHVFKKKKQKKKK
jgi:small subunit ribosomal protein S19